MATLSWQKNSIGYRFLFIFNTYYTGLAILNFRCQSAHELDVAS